jgi:6-pyruvoyltetrahydropterin/6-carboxytetrahydropterin synthase
MRITKTFRFEASHVLPYHAGKCARLHGHSYQLDVTAAGPLNSGGSSAGMVMDFADLSGIVKDRVIGKLDHAHINDLLENPTCERLLLWIWAALCIDLPAIESITLWETNTARGTLQRGDPEVAS